MPLEVREQSIPGVGKKYELDIDTHRTVSVLIHSNGRRELFYRNDEESEDFQELLDLTDAQARTLGLFLVGAYYQPISTNLGQQSKGGAYVDWYAVEEDSVLFEAARSAVDFGNATLLGVDREGTIHSTVEDEFTFQIGDQLIVVGTDGAHETFSDYVYEE